MNQTREEVYYESIDPIVSHKHVRSDTQQQIKDQSTHTPIGSNPYYHACVNSPSDNPKSTIIVAQFTPLDNNETSTSTSQNERDESDYYVNDGLNCPVVTIVTSSAQPPSQRQTSTVAKDHEESQTATCTTARTGGVDEDNYYVNEGLDKPATKSSVSNPLADTVTANNLTVSSVEEDQEYYTYVNESLNQVASAKARNDLKGDTKMQNYLEIVDLKQNIGMPRKDTVQHTNDDESSKHDIQTLPNKAYTHVHLSVSTLTSSDWHVNEGLHCTRAAATAWLRDNNPTSSDWHINEGLHRTRAAATAWLRDDNPTSTRVDADDGHNSVSGGSTQRTGTKCKVSTVSVVHDGCDYYSNEGLNEGATMTTQSGNNTRQHFESSLIRERGYNYNKSTSDVDRLGRNIDSKARRGASEMPNDKTKGERPSPGVVKATRDRMAPNSQGTLV